MILPTFHIYCVVWFIDAWWIWCQLIRKFMSIYASIIERHDIWWSIDNIFLLIIYVFVGPRCCSAVVSRRAADRTQSRVGTLLSSYEQASQWQEAAVGAVKWWFYSWGKIYLWLEDWRSDVSIMDIFSWNSDTALPWYIHGRLAMIAHKNHSTFSLWICFNLAIKDRRYLGLSYLKFSLRFCIALLP